MIDPKNKKIIINQIVIWALFYLISVLLYKYHYGIHFDSDFAFKYSIFIFIIFVINIWITSNLLQPEINELEDKLINKEKEITQERSKLETENRLYKILFDSVEDPVFILSENLNLFYFNNKFSGLFNIDSNDFNRPIIQVIRTHDFQTSLEKTINEGTLSELTTFCYPNEADPNKKYFHLKIIPIKFSAYFLCILHDITEKKLTDQIKEDFISNFSHEIRTPLTILNGQIHALTSTLKNPKANSDEVNELICKIENNSRRLSGLFEDMLNLTQVEKKKNLVFEEFDLEPIIENVCQDLKMKYPQKAITYNIKLNCSQIFADYNLFEQCLMNLIDNAIKYSRENPIINISTDLDKEFTSITVQDNGVGIPEDQKHRIFERFFRIDHSRSQIITGTGLGLSIVKHIIQKHNGKLKVSSEVNIGTTISILIPNKLAN